MAKNDTTVANQTPDEKLKALEAARLQIEKQYGVGSLMQLGKYDNPLGIEAIPSGSILLDEALGVGGYPRGRIIEIYGPESSGKTTLALHAIAEAQKKGGIAAFIDAEHALDPVYAKNLGVNTDDLWVSQPDNGEQALEIAESLVRITSYNVCYTKLLRFRQVILGAHLDALDDDIHFVECRDHDHRDYSGGGIVLEMLQQLDSVHPWHDHVKQHLV